jgi:hypothetical protein
MTLSADDLTEIRAGLAELSPEDRQLAEAQRLCPVQGKPLGIMGKPVKVELGDKQAVFVCCKGCAAKAMKDPAAMLKKVEDFKRLPPILMGDKP